MSTPQESLKKQLEYTGVLDWRNNGMTGKGVKVWNGESDSGHGNLTRSVIEQVALDAEVISASSGFRTDRNKLLDGNVFVTYKEVRLTLDEFLQQEEPQILSQSTTGGSRCQEYVDYCKRIVEDYSLKIFNCGGNDGDEGEDNLSTKWPIEIVIAIGALNFMKNEYPERAGYSSVGEELDFCQFTSFHTGTSFATPFVAGQTAMIYQRYGEMSFDETYQYLKMISDDLGVKDHDSFYGWGQPILPKFEKKYITMTTEGRTYAIDGMWYEMDTKPVNIEGNVFVPIRAISESLGATVDWKFNSDKTIRIEIYKDSTKLVLNTESTLAWINGKKVRLNFAPYIDENDRTLVPIRFIAEGLSCKVDWVQSEGKVMILEL